MLMGSQHFNSSSISMASSNTKHSAIHMLKQLFYSFEAQEWLDLWKHKLPILQRWLCHNSTRNKMNRCSLKGKEKRQPWQMPSMSIKTCMDLKQKKCLFPCYIWRYLSLYSGTTTQQNRTSAQHAGTQVKSARRCIFWLRNSLPVWRAILRKRLKTGKKKQQTNQQNHQKKTQTSPKKHEQANAQCILQLNSPLIFLTWFPKSSLSFFPSFLQSQSNLTAGKKSQTCLGLEGTAEQSMQQRQHWALAERQVVSAPPRGSAVPLPSQTGKELEGLCRDLSANPQEKQFCEFSCWEINWS